MQRDTIVKLGDFAFTNTEVPQEIPYGGGQGLVIHKLVGGKRIIDAMGEDNAPLTWNGLMIGPTADKRARYLDTLRVKGGELKLTWGDHSYRVIIREFVPTYQRFYQVPYRITCEVVADETMEMNWIFEAPIDQAIADDMAKANALGGSIGDGTLSGLLSTLDTAIGKVSSFAKAGQATLNSVLKPLAAVMARVKILNASVGNVLKGAGTLGGVLPSNKSSQSIGKVLGVVSAVTQAGYLWQIAGVLGRIGGNIGAISSSSTQKTVAGGNLFQISQKNYGDATNWTTIAKASGTSDPMVSGVKTLTIPATPDNQGGVLIA